MLEFRSLSSVKAAADDFHTDPGHLIERYGDVTEALDAILDALQVRAGKWHPHDDRFYLSGKNFDTDRIEKLVSRFYSGGDRQRGGKLLNWYFSVGGEYAIQLAFQVIRSAS